MMKISFYKIVLIMAILFYGTTAQLQTCGSGSTAKQYDPQFQLCCCNSQRTRCLVGPGFGGRGRCCGTEVIHSSSQCCNGSPC